MNYPVFLFAVERIRHYCSVLCPPASPSVTTASRLFDLVRRGAVGCVRGGGGTGGSPLLLLVISQLLMGASLVVYYVVAIYRLDRNVRRPQMPLYYWFLLLLASWRLSSATWWGPRGAVGRRPPRGLRRP